MRGFVPMLALALVVPLSGCLSVLGLGDGVGDPPPAPAALEVELVLPEDAHAGDDLTLRTEVQGASADRLFHFWSFGDGRDARGPDLASVEHAYAESGLYEVEVLVIGPEGAEGRAEALLPVNQAFRFEGTVSSGEIVPTAENHFGASVPVGANATQVTAEVALDHGDGPLSGHRPGDSRVTLRFTHAAEGGSDGKVVAERAVDVPSEGVTVQLAATAPAIREDGDLTFEVVAEEGRAHFVADVRVAYDP